jgi:RNA polymerase sigma-70 factor (ECF subfamily)
MEVARLDVRTPDPETRMDASMTEAEDVAKAAAGDRRAFERLYRGNVNRIHSLAARMLNHSEAAEVTQDVFVRAWQKLGSFRGEARFGTWLHRIAVNVIFDRRARYARDRERFLDDQEHLETLPSRAPQRDTRMDFEAAIAGLPAGARAIFLLHDVEGYRHEEIAEFLEVTTGTTKAQLHRARMLMRRALDA